MSRATRPKAAVTRRRENDEYAPLLEALRKLTLKPELSTLCRASKPVVSDLFRAS